MVLDNMVSNKPQLIALFFFGSSLTCNLAFDSALQVLAVSTTSQDISGEAFA